VADDRPLRSDARRNREQILTVAREAFATDGLSVSLDEIARRAGVGPGTLYRHFPTKETLFEAVVHHRLLGLLQDARGRHDAPDPAAALFGFLQQMIDEAAPKMDLIHALERSGVGLETTIAATGTQLRSEVGHLLARAQGQGAVRQDITPDDLMALLSGLLHVLGPRSTHHADPQRTLSVVLQGLRPDAPHEGSSASRRATRP